MSRISGRREICTSLSRFGLGGHPSVPSGEESAPWAGRNIRLTYFNASLTQRDTRHARMASPRHVRPGAGEHGRFQPDVILIACNTFPLSIA